MSLLLLLTLLLTMSPMLILLYPQKIHILKLEIFHHLLFRTTRGRSTQEVEVEIKVILVDKKTLRNIDNYSQKIK